MLRLAAMPQKDSNNFVTAIHWILTINIPMTLMLTINCSVAAQDNIITNIITITIIIIINTILNTITKLFSSFGVKYMPISARIHVRTSDSP